MTDRRECADCGLLTGEGTELVNGNTLLWGEGDDIGLAVSAGHGVGRDRSGKRQTDGMEVMVRNE